MVARKDTEVLTTERDRVREESGVCESLLEKIIIYKSFICVLY